MKRKFMIILLSAILLSGCNTYDVKSANNLGYLNDYTNVSYVEGKKDNINETTTSPVTTTTTTTTSAVPVNTTTTSKVIVDTTTTKKVTTTQKTTTTTKKTTTTVKTTTVPVTTTQVVENKPVYTGPTTNELIDEANAYITKYKDKIDEMINLINIERAKEGISPVTYDYKLTLAATIRALEMHYTGVFEHARYCKNNEVKFKLNQKTGKEELDTDWCSSWVSVYNDLNITYNIAAENIARGYSRVDKAMYGSNPEVLGGFMGSPSHRKNIMNPKLKYVGIGVAESGPTSYYFAQEFKA